MNSSSNLLLESLFPTRGNSQKSRRCDIGHQIMVGASGIKSFVDRRCAITVCFPSQSRALQVMIILCVIAYGGHHIAFTMSIAIYIYLTETEVEPFYVRRTTFGAI